MVLYEIIVYEMYFHIYVIEHTLILGGTLQTAQDTHQCAHQQTL